MLIKRGLKNMLANAIESRYILRKFVYKMLRQATGVTESKLIPLSSEKAMKKKLLLTLIFPTSFFLIFLGIRNPSLEKNSGPKQRPRAITENVVKASQEICSSPCTVAEICQLFALQLPVPASSPFVDNSHPSTFSIHARPASRAPPRTFSV